MSSSATVSNPVPPPPPTTTTQPSPQTLVKNDLKQIGICLPSNTQMEIANTANSSTGQSLNLSYSNATKNVVTNSTNNFYTTATTAGQFQMSSLSVMVAKLNPARQQTVILQPRINTTRGATLQIQNSVRNSSGNSLPNSQTISTSLSSSNSSSISVRTRVIGGQGNHASTTIPLSNLSAVAASSNTTTSGSSNTSSNVTTNSMKQMLTGQKFITASNVETVNLMISNPNEVRNLKTNVQNNEIKSLYKINGPKQLTGSTTATAALVTAQTTPKMISINNASGHQSCAATTTRFGILSSNANAKSAVINLPKNFIITPTGASGIANMVSISSANFPANRIPLSRQHTVTTTLSAIQSSNSTLPSTTTTTTATVTAKPTPTTIYTVNTTNQTAANVLNNPNIITTLQPIMTNQQQSNSHQTSNIISTSSTTSSIAIANNNNNNTTKQAMNIQTINSISPIKSTTINLSFPIHHHQSMTPSSPRPRILSRKRTITETPTTITIKPNNINSNNNTTNGSLAFVTTATAANNPSSTTKNQQLPNITNDKSIINVNILDTNKIETNNNKSSSNNNNNIVQNSQNYIEINNNLTPRKKPRKQLLEPSSSISNRNKFITGSSSSTIVIHQPLNNDQHQNHHQLLVNNHNNNEQQQLCLKKTECKDIQQPKLMHIKKPRLSIINYHSNGKLPQFSSYNDVKPKNDKKLTLQDLLNDVRKQNEWKDIILTDQCKKLADDEESFTLKRLELLLSTLENEISPFSKCAAMTTLYDEIDNQPPPPQQQQQRTSKINCIDRKCVRINDIIRANIQRSKVLCEHFIDCNQIIHRVTYEHKDKVTNLTKRLNNKRSSSSYSK
ncbi:uncharacterized protein LOC124500027 [Dermatophagoides farinae]|uniref:Uncharacterized protein n=1 Tax=Dermatophagoides farinae TaxID=6954 RepID=A0A9D4SL34_DERFA|nr:putative uncharacterized protein DDB_G0277255 [Dermatophagoides farinae]XP_046919999.1 putative uncharacterized protein DDB_G0277255 [Dermatophagoides farinae]KAH7645727.1 hypothetical protein HUG17_1265 [Dermatophagoides farinae]